MKTNKGFTMVELLVAMVILGLLILMAFPTIRAIQANNRKSNFEQFGKTVLSASKLYVDSYKEDIFDLDQKYGNADVTVYELNKKNLINKTGISGTTCTNSKVFVLKYNDDFTYCLHLVCSSGSKVVYESNDKDKKKQCANLDLIKVTYKSSSEERFDEIMKGTTNYSVKAPSSLGFTNIASIKGWKDQSSGQKYNFGDKISGPINSPITLKATNEAGGSGSLPDTPEDPNKNYVRIKYNVNGGRLADSHGNVSIKNGLVYDTANGTEKLYVQKVAYGEKLAEGGLVDFNDSDLLNLIYDYKHIGKDEKDNNKYITWDTKADGSGTSFNQDNQYDASDFCDASKGDCEITLYAKWTDNTCTIKYHPNKGKFNNHPNDTTVKYTHGETIGGSENGMRNARGENGYYYATRSGYVVAAWAEWNTDSKGEGKGYDQDLKYEVEKVCPDLKTEPDKEVTLYVKWLIQSKPIRLIYMDYYEKNCNPSSGYPYRRYKFYQYRCTCVYKSTNSKLDTHKAFYMKHKKNACGSGDNALLYRNANKNQLENCFITHSTIKYRNNDDGKKACNNNGHKINQYVYDVCSNENLHSNHNAVFFHGNFWYWGEEQKNPDKGFKKYYSPKTTYWLIDKKSAFSNKIDLVHEQYTINIPKDSASSANKYSYDQDTSNEVQRTCKDYCEQMYGDYRYGDDDTDMEEDD